MNTAFNAHFSKKQPEVKNLRLSVSHTARPISTSKLYLKANKKERPKSYEAKRNQANPNKLLPEYLKQNVKTRPSSRLSQRSEDFEVLSIDSIQMDHLEVFKNSMFRFVTPIKKHIEPLPQIVQIVPVNVVNEQPIKIKRLSLQSRKNNRYAQLLKSRNTTKQHIVPKLTMKDLSQPMQIDLNGWSVTSNDQLQEAK